MKRFSFASSAFAVAALFCLSLVLAESVASQAKLSRLDRDRAFGMLNNVRKKIKSEYYDPEFRGKDIDARFDAAEERMKDAGTLGDAFSIIAQAVLDLNDSHTTFFPPSRNAIVDYGWKMRMFGDKCLVTQVREGSDAAKKGLEKGDEILGINRFPPTRSELWKMVYFYQTLNPQTQVTLAIKKPDGEIKQLLVDTKVTRQKAVLDINNHMDFNEAQREGARLANANPHRFADVGSVKIWRMPSFAFDPGEVERLTAQFKNSSALIVDLRGNGGGYVKTLEEIAGYFFTEDKKIADLVGRKKMDPQMAKTKGGRAFTGKVVVLIDSASGSASEIFARLMQLEKRGTVLGDISAGAVMQSMGHSLDAGSESSIAYGVNVTNADVIMSDGKSLEHVGVTPDEKIIPTPADIAAGRDPVIARALEVLGVEMTPVDAGRLFPPPPYIERMSNLAFIIEGWNF